LLLTFPDKEIYQVTSPVTILRTTLTLLLLVAAVLLAAGCAMSGSGNIIPTVSASSPTKPAFPVPVTQIQAVCPPHEHKEYRVVQGESFTYSGSVPENANHSVDVFVTSGGYPLLLPWQRPVDTNGTFSFTINGNATKQDWEDYRDMHFIPGWYAPSPYKHICLRYSTGTECFDLLIVQDKQNLTSNKQNDWIRIDPLTDQVLSESEMQRYTGNFFINGTTNLLPGQEINLTMGSTCMLPCPKAANSEIGCCGSYYEAASKIDAGPCGVNTWSFLVNTAPNRIRMMRVNSRYGNENDLFIVVTWANRTIDSNAWDLKNLALRSKDEFAP
jgi:hypothetical protein